MRALSEPSLPGQMLFQASRLPQAGLLLPQHRHPTFTPTPGPSPNFSCPCRAGQSQAQPKPLLSLHRPICEQPRPTGAPQGRWSHRFYGPSSCPRPPAPFVCSNPSSFSQAGLCRSRWPQRHHPLHGPVCRMVLIPHLSATRAI